MRRSLGVVVGAAFGVVFVATCGHHPGVDAMLDMAGLGGDGAQGMMDIATADAQPVPATEVACDKASVRTDAGTTTTSYFAELSAPGLDPAMAPHVSVITCNYEYFGSSRSSIDNFIACPAGSATCQASGYAPSVSATACSVTNYLGWVGSGRLVIYCGQRVQTASTDSGYRAKTLYVRIN